MKPKNTPSALADIYRQHAGKVLGTLRRLCGDLDLAEEVMHEAFVIAMQTWPEQGLPDNPSAWLISAGHHKALDVIRRQRRFSELQSHVVASLAEIEAHNNELAAQSIEDDQLRLIFTCCHPAIDPLVQIPLTLREVCGLTTDEIASAFLTSTATMAQRIVRGKTKIRDAGIPFAIPALHDLPERRDAVLKVIYLVFNEGYAASGGETLTRAPLSLEAIRLARLVLTLLPDSEVEGLLALMLLHESRRTARTDAAGDIVLLEHQDRTRWNRAFIEEGCERVKRVLGSGRFGPYTLQAAISAVHAEAASASATDWQQIVALYTVLMHLDASPIIELNRAVAIAMRDGPEAGLALVDAILARGDLTDYHLCHATRGELLVRAGQSGAAVEAFERALSLTHQAPEQRFLQLKLAQIKKTKNF